MDLSAVSGHIGHEFIETYSKWWIQKEPFLTDVDGVWTLIITNLQQENENMRVGWCFVDFPRSFSSLGWR